MAARRTALNRTRAGRLGSGKTLFDRALSVYSELVSVRGGKNRSRFDLKGHPARCAELLDTLVPMMPVRF